VELVTISIALKTLGHQFLVRLCKYFVGAAMWPDAIITVAAFLLSYPVKLVAWHSGRTSVSGRRTFPVLRSTCS